MIQAVGMEVIASGVSSIQDLVALKEIVPLVPSPESHLYSAIDLEQALQIIDRNRADQGL